MVEICIGLFDLTYTGGCEVFWDWLFDMIRRWLLIGFLFGVIPFHNDCCNA